MEPRNKSIIFCSDGTGNSTIKDRGTNVFKLFEAIDVNGHRSDPALRRQLAFYDDGVGTENLKYLRILSGATGYGLSRNVKQLYRELCRVYEPGDDIYLFGFSRGAFTVRTLAGLINDCGILDVRHYETEDAFRAHARAAYAAYRRKYLALLTPRLVRRGIGADEFKRRFARKDQAEQPIRFLGVWDTVDAVGLPFKLADFWNTVVWQYKFRTSTLCRSVRRGCQALALDDERAEFEPVLWDEGDPYTKSRVTQVWFAGAHSNVGGGYPQQGMSLVALDWMMKHAEEEDLRFVPHLRDQYSGEQSFADKLYDPRSGSGMFYRWRPRDVAALCAERSIPAPKIHVSVIERIVQGPDGYAPGNLPTRLEVVATEDRPLVRLDEVARVIAKVHGPSGTPLIERKGHWVTVGLLSYLSFLIGIGVGTLRTLALMLVAPWVDPLGFINSVGEIFDSMPFGWAWIWWADPYARFILLGGLAVGYVLAWWSARQAARFFSGFWHKHRDSLREALRRTPGHQGPPASLSPEAEIDISKLSRSHVQAS